MGMQRRQFLQSLAAAGTAAGAGRLPNIAIIYCDDLGYGDLGCYGSAIRTPNIDRLASEGIRFTNFYSGNPVCSPSRAALLTGRYCVRAGVPKVLFPVNEVGMPESETTIAQTLKPKGYRTMCVGKWHLGHREKYLPTAKGFDHYFGIPYSNDMKPRWLMDDTKVIEEEAALETLTPRYTARAVQFVEESAKAGEPFFLYMPHTYPHIPLGASAKFPRQIALGDLRRCGGGDRLERGGDSGGVEANRGGREHAGDLQFGQRAVVSGQPGNFAREERIDVGGRAARAVSRAIPGADSEGQNLARRGGRHGSASHHRQALRSRGEEPF